MYDRSEMTPGAKGRSLQEVFKKSSRSLQGNLSLADCEVLRCSQFFGLKFPSESEEHMNGQVSLSPLERRSFLSRLSAGVTAFAAVVAGGAATGYGQSSAAASWQPERHEKDDWVDKRARKHRIVFDTTTPGSLGNALAFANNFIRVNRNDYGLQNSDVAVIVIVRPKLTGFGDNDAILAKEGGPNSD